MLPFTIRKAVPTDVGALERCSKPALNRTFTQELDDQLAGVHSMYLALRDQKIVGTGFVRWLGPRDPEAARLFPNAPEILRLDIAEPYRSQGIGTKLISEIEQEALTRGFSQLSLGVAHTNPRAHSLYLKLGFEQTSIFEYYDEYQWQTANGSIESAKDLCRYLVKKIPGET